MIIEPVSQTIQFQQMLTIQPLKIIQTMSKLQKATFAEVLIDADISFTKNYKKCQQIEKQVQAIINQCKNNQTQKQKNNNNGVKDDDYYTFVNKCIVNVFKVFQNKYFDNTKRRRFLHQFCEKLQCVKRSTHKYFQIVKKLENMNQKQSYLLQLLRTLPVIKRSENKVFDLYRYKQQQAHQAVQYQIKRLFHSQFKNKFVKEPVIQFQRLSEGKNQTISLFFSGFGSQTKCKAYQWRGFLNKIKHQAYSVRWQSKTLDGLYQFGRNQGIIQGLSRLPGVRKLQTVGKVVNNLNNNNPYNQAQHNALIVGNYIADILINNFEGHFINLIGFSLGTELIKNIISRLQQKSKLGMINKVYLMGGVADKLQIQNILKQTKENLTLYNFYTKNDTVISILFKTIKSHIDPIGLRPIIPYHGHQIINQDCSQYVKGHEDYRQKMDILSQMFSIQD